MKNIRHAAELMITQTDRMPTWGKGGPWPMELGVATLMLWLAECFRQVDTVRVRFPGNLYVWELVGTYRVQSWAVFAGIAMMITIGVIFSGACPRFGRRLRIAGLTLSAVALGVLAVQFLFSYDNSVAGGLFLFVAWRTAVVASVHYKRECRRGRRP